MKVLLVALLFSALAASSASAAPITYSAGAGQPNSNAAPIAQERATRNSDGGDREHGGFGPAQSAYVNSIVDAGGSYGQDVIQAGGWTAK